MVVTFLRPILISIKGVTAKEELADVPTDVAFN